MEEDNNSPPPRRQQPPPAYRSNNSINWRLKDDSPRQQSPQQPQQRYQRDNNAGYEQNRSSPRGGYGGRREGGDYQPREPREIPGKPESSRLYVGNLLYTAQAGDITNFFSENGYNVVNVSMSIDPATGRNPSYCFVDLESVEDATRAMEQLNGSEVMGRTVRINPGVARREGQSGGQRRPYGQESGSRGWGARESTGNNESGAQRPSNERSWGSGSQQYNRPPPTEQGKRLYIGGLPPIEPQNAVEAEITTLFSRANPAIEIANVSNLIAPHASKAGEPGDHHYLFVDLKAETDADRAIEMFHDIESPWSEGGRLKVNRAREARDRESRDGPRRGGRDGGASRGYGGPRGWGREQPQE